MRALLKFLRKSESGPTEATEPDEPSVIKNLRKTAENLREASHEIKRQLQHTKLSLDEVVRLSNSLDQKEIAERVIERIDSGTLGAIKLWVEDARERGRHDRETTAQLLKRWREHSERQDKEIKSLNETITMLEMEVRKAESPQGS